MSEHAEVKHDPTGGDAAPAAVPAAAPATTQAAPHTNEPEEHGKTSDSPFAQLSKAADVAGTGNVFGMFGGGSKKTEAPEEEENDRSGSSKAKAKAAEDVR